MAIDRVTHDWTSLETGARRDAAHGALDKLAEVAPLYERYLALARLTDFPTADDPMSELIDIVPTTDRPLGLIVDPSAYPVAPLGFKFGDPS